MVMNSEVGARRPECIARGQLIWIALGISLLPLAPPCSDSRSPLVRTRTPELRQINVSPPSTPPTPFVLHLIYNAYRLCCEASLSTELQLLAWNLVSFCLRISP